jgi:hypothetical protein
MRETTVNPMWCTSPGVPDTTESMPVMMAPVTTHAIACCAFRPYASRLEPVEYALMHAPETNQ